MSGNGNGTSLPHNAQERFVGRCIFSTCRVLRDWKDSIALMRICDRSVLSLSS